MGFSASLCFGMTVCCMNAIWITYGLKEPVKLVGSPLLEGMYSIHFIKHSRVRTDLI